MPQQCGDDAVVAQVLQVMVQHVEDLSMRDVARLLQLSSACRRALQQAVGRLNMGCWPNRVTSAAATTGFAAWLPRHAGLLGELRLTRPVASDEDDAAWAAAEQLVVFALQISSTPPGLPAAAAAGAPQPPSQPAAVLRLESFSSNYVHNPAALHSLAGCSHLTELELTAIPPQRFTAALCSAIGQLRSLRTLRLLATAAAAVYPSSLGAAVAQLTQLEVLDVFGRLPLAALPQLPPSLIDARMGVQLTGRRPADVNISHLSRLDSLEVTVPGRISAQSQLPDSMTSLTLIGAADAVPGLGQLQFLHVLKPTGCLALLQRLPELPALQQVKVRLQECKEGQIQPVLAALGAGTQLTGLQLYFSDPSQDFDGVGEPRLADMLGLLPHAYLKKLPQLQLLHMSGIELDSSDLLHFTALTALTDLRIAYCRGQVDLGIAAIMQRLTGLRKLHLEGLELSSPLIWVAAACLTNLQHLHCILSNNIAVTDETLHLLAPLSNLTHLDLDGGEFAEDEEGAEYMRRTVSRAAERKLLRHMPLLRKIEWAG